MRAWLFLLTALPAAAATCESLGSTLAIPHSTVTVTAVPAGAFTPAGGQPIAGSSDRFGHPATPLTRRSPAWRPSG